MGTQASRTIIFDAPLQKAVRVITDYESYPEFLDDITEVTVEKREGHDVIALFRLKVVMEIEYTLRLTESLPHRISWTLVSGQMMKSNNGGWELKALSPQRTEAVYSLEVGLKGLIPTSVTTRLIDITLPKTLEAFKKRIESLS